jgi:hypothetical protein
MEHHLNRTQKLKIKTVKNRNIYKVKSVLLVTIKEILNGLYFT